MQKINVRETPLRNEICKILQRAQKPLSVPELQKKLKGLYGNTHKTSLYRNLEHLSHAGIVDRIVIDPQQIYYEIQNTHHHHVMCRNCQSIACITSTHIEHAVHEAQQLASKESLYVIDEHQFAFFGLCKKCK